MVDTLQLAEDFEVGGLTPEGAKRAARSIAENIEKGYVTRCHFDAAMADQRAYFDTAMADQRAYFDTAMADQRAEFKQDIADLRAEFKADIASLRAEMKADKLDLVKWMVGLNAATIGILFALLRLTG